MLKKALLLGGAASSVLYLVAIDLIAARRHRDYHDYTSQMVSELMAVGAPTRPLLTRLFVPYNLLVFGLAGGVWLAAGESRARRLLSASLLGYGAVSSAGLLVAPMDLRGTVNSKRDRVHIVVTGIMSLLIVITMMLGAFVHGRLFRLYSFTTVALVMAFGVRAAVLARPMPGDTPGIGLAERVNIYATMAWFAVLAVSLLREDPPNSASRT